ncbi:hypothetical protein AAG570_004582 [Ranatra chinensis]|uniref:Uncharacterized protein n=1 Tax=Ranatra chinensis TaxID=642074 RepID=A0ABD0Y1A4_9HEMI
MASKRRNMFHKNKTQETTENVPNVDLMTGIENSIRLSRSRVDKKSAAIKKAAANQSRRRKVCAKVKRSVRSHVRRMVKSNGQMLPQRPAYFPAFAVPGQYPSMPTFATIPSHQPVLGGGISSQYYQQPIIYAINPPKRKNKKMKERHLRTMNLMVASGDGPMLRWRPGGLGEAALTKSVRLTTAKDIPRILATFKIQRDRFLGYLQLLQKQIETTGKYPTQALTLKRAVSASRLHQEDLPVTVVSRILFDQRTPPFTAVVVPWVPQMGDFLFRFEMIINTLVQRIEFPGLKKRPSKKKPRMVCRKCQVKTSMSKGKRKGANAGGGSKKKETQASGGTQTAKKAPSSVMPSASSAARASSIRIRPSTAVRSKADWQKDSEIDIRGRVV